METGIHGACDITHFQTCLLHGDKRTTRCSGTLNKGGNCAYRAVGSFKPGMMPTCHIHRRQLKRTSWCRAPLRCGFECGRICEWKLHGFSLCLDHREHPMTCYFLAIPMEMRLRIYELLLPDRPIPAIYEKSNLTSDGRGVCTPILCVNRQIHDEAAGLLYRTRAFSIELHADWLIMCNSFQNLAQNKPLAYESPTLEFDLIEPVWDPPLSEKYFNMIQFFRVEIVLPSFNAWLLPNLDNTGHKAPTSRLLDCCDHLHRLIGRLRNIQGPIVSLEIVIQIGSAYLNRGDAFPVAQFLLRPFRRLRNVARPDLLSITIQDPAGEAVLLKPDWASSPAGGKFAAYLEHLFNHMSSSQPPPELPVFKAYWQLEKLLSYIKEHYRHSDPKIRQIAGQLYSARFAREFEDLARFKTIWNQVVDIWFDCLNQQVVFQSNVAISIDAIYGTVLNGS